MNKDLIRELDKMFLDWNLQELPVDSDTYINHYMCPAGTDTKHRRWVKRVETGYSTYCHHCGEKKFYHCKPKQSLFGETRVNPKQQKATGKLPADYQKEIPTEGLLWLFKYDITLEEIERYGIGYSSSHNCVVLPVTRRIKMGSPHTEVVYWQGRKLGTDAKGKKLGYHCPPNTKMHNFYSTNTWGDTLVLVEDYLSCIRVGRYVKTVALFGTKISSEVWQTAIRAKKVLVWLDYDQKDKPYIYTNNLELYTKAAPIITTEDPKCYSDLEIKRLIDEALRNV